MNSTISNRGTFFYWILAAQVYENPLIYTQWCYEKKYRSYTKDLTDWYIDVLQLQGI